jgi:poly(3-hydroxybutyrate) depolymerase
VPVTTLTLLFAGAPLASAQSGRKPAACDVSLDFPTGCTTRGPLGTPYQAGVNCRVASVDGFPRQYVVYVPVHSRQAMPVVVMHHGSSGNGVQFLGISGWKEKAEEVGLVAVFPTALEGFVLDEQRCSTKWHAYGLEHEIDLTVRPRLRVEDGTTLPYPPAAPWPADDVAFERAMVDDVRAQLDVDLARVFVSGFSNGAGFAARLALEMSDVFAAAAYSGGGLPDPTLAGLPAIPERHIPVAMELGQCDDRLMERIAADFDPDACVRGAATGLPLDPAALQAIPSMVGWVGLHLTPLELQPEPFETRTGATSTCMLWSTRTNGNGDANSFRFSVLARVTHQYPTCNQERCNNPARFSAADRFWAFFSGQVGCP